ncbi:MAG: hypothetical protein FWD91_06720, partial [Treponema sp.]|nr:hypothetical protein [Treponema sp.]
MRKLGLLVFSILFLVFSSCDLDDLKSQYSKDKNSKSENNLKQNSHLEGNSQSGYNSQGSQQTAGLATVS